MENTADNAKHNREEHERRVLLEWIDQLKKDLGQVKALADVLFHCKADRLEPGTVPTLAGMLSVTARSLEIISSELDRNLQTRE